MFSAIRWGAAALMLATFFAGPAQADNIVINPGFETGNFNGWSPSGDISFTGVDNFSPHSGRFGAFLSTSVRQVFSPRHSRRLWEFHMTLSFG